MKNSKNMPALFIGHGSPMNALEDNAITDSWKQLGKDLPQPRAILVISAHWYVPITAITSQDKNITIHDFYGFPQELATYDYESNGSKFIAEEIKSVLAADEEINLLENTWGLDHGAWSVLTHMYTKPAMPILQLSINMTKPAEWHFEVGKKLAKLRKNGVMLLGSGNIVHNLGIMSWHKPDYGYDWAYEFDAKVIELIKSRNLEPLTNYLKLTSSALNAAPTPEHYLPLLYILGAMISDDEIIIFNQKYQYGSLSMTSVLLS